MLNDASPINATTTVESAEAVVSPPDRATVIAVDVDDVDVPPVFW
jgi:hypothetical protein